MDYDKLIEQLWNYSAHNNMLSNLRTIRDAATAIETLRADLARVTAERDAAIKELNEFLAMDELCPIQCEWCKWKDTFCDGKTPEWSGIKED